MQLRFMIALLWLAMLLSACDVNVTSTGTPTPGGYPGPAAPAVAPSATPSAPYPSPTSLPGGASLFS